MPYQTRNSIRLSDKARNRLEDILVDASTGWMTVRSGITETTSTTRYVGILTKTNRIINGAITVEIRPLVYCPIKSISDTQTNIKRGTQNRAARWYFKINLLTGGTSHFLFQKRLAIMISATPYVLSLNGLGPSTYLGSNVIPSSCAASGIATATNKPSANRFIEHIDTAERPKDPLFDK